MKFSSILLALTVLANAATADEPQQVVLPSVCKNNKQFALTFDEGPHLVNTPIILDTLRSLGVKATFHVSTAFLNDPNVQALITRIAKEGHLLGFNVDPTFSIAGLTASDLKAYFQDAGAKLAQFNSGKQPKFVRLLFNSYSDLTVNNLLSAGYLPTGYTDSYDYQVSAATLVSWAKQMGTLDSGIVFKMMDGSNATSPDVLKGAIAAWTAAGNSMVTLDTCLGESNPYYNGKIDNTYVYKGENGSVISVSPTGTTSTSVPGSSPSTDASSAAAGSGGSGSNIKAPTSGAAELGWTSSFVLGSTILAFIFQFL